MKLFLHIGTEKTGSSALQSVCAKNRQKLLDKGVYFPKTGELEDQMLRGEISNGNAQFVADLIVNNKWDELENKLVAIKKDAESKLVNQILLSNELIMLSLDGVDSVNKLSAILKKYFEDVNILLVIREPIDQAVSLYKHKAKGGEIENVGYWIKNNYYYSQKISAFLKANPSNLGNLFIRKYIKNASSLNKLFFNDWLGFYGELVTVEKPVNPSLSFSEIELLRISKLDRARRYLLYNRLIDIPIKRKNRSHQLENIFRQTIKDELIKDVAVWEHCNKYLLEDEKLLDYTFDYELKENEDATIELSTFQFEIISNFFSNYDSLSTLMYVAKFNAKQMVGKLIKALKIR